MTLRVLDPGLYALIVDNGRPATRSLGAPVGGAADRFSLAIGNGLVGNPPDAAALEISLGGPTIQADCDLACVVYGAPFQLTSDRQELTADKTFTLHAGEKLKIGGTPTGVRAYLCVQGGLQTPVVLGSRSGLAPLEAGAELPCAPGTIAGRFIDLTTPWISDPGVLRVIDGPQMGCFQRDEFFGQHFVVTPASNRMGLRLRGKPLRVPSEELLSEPACPGTVQVTNDGQCVVLGVDGQPTGGYPKIAQVVTADVDRLGQLRPGDRIRFDAVSLEEAEGIYREKQSSLEKWLLRLRESLRVACC
jgi:biotin-dependent carboxylase-like uncharacterized protein